MGQFEAGDELDTQFWQDIDGYAPSHLSVIGGHPLTTEALLGTEYWEGSRGRKLGIQKLRSRSSEVLALATKESFAGILKLLITAGVNSNYQDGQEETAIHLAARFGHTECVQALLHGHGNQKANTELAENAFG